MTILVTGGAGYIGSHMAHLLHDEEVRHVLLDDLSTGKPFLPPKDSPLIEGSVGDRNLLDQVIEEHGITAIIHFAGSIVVPESVSDPLKYYANNTSNSRVLIEAAVAHGVGAFLFSSTAAVYGTPERVPIPEEAILQPISPYGTSKLMTEWMLRDAGAAHGLRSVALRYFNVAGADAAGRSGQAMDVATHLIKIASEVATGKREQLSIFGTDYDTPDGTCIRDYIHVSDLVRAHLLALRYLEEGGQSAVFNCGYGRGSSVFEVIAALEAANGIEIPKEIAGRRAGDPPRLVADARRIRATLGWQPEFEDLHEIVRSALAWEKRLNVR